MNNFRICKKMLDIIRIKVYNIWVGGAWRSLVAHMVWDHGAAGSNPVAPTKIDKIRQSLVDFTFYFFTLHYSLKSNLSI